MNLPDFENAMDQQAAVFMCRLLYVLPAAFIIFIGERVAAGNWFETALLSAMEIIFAVCFWLVLKKQISASILTLSIAFLTMITSLATMGDGIHDIVIAGYPILLMVMSLLMNPRLLLVICGLTLACLGWIVYGNLYGIFGTDHGVRATGGDFIVTATIFMVAAYAAHLLASSQKRNLDAVAGELKQNQALSQRLETGLSEQSELLKEVHHRVKNNLAVISSMLHLQERRIENREEAIDAFADMRKRIRSISLVHERLYQTGSFGKVDMKPYIQAVVRNLVQTVKGADGVFLKAQVKAVSLSMEQAVPFGMLLSEVLNNAYKRALQSDPPPRIEVTLAEDSFHECRLTVARIHADGRQSRCTLDPTPFSEQLITLMMEQLGARWEAHHLPVDHFEIVFPIQDSRHLSRKMQPSHQLRSVVDA